METRQTKPPEAEVTTEAALVALLDAHSIPHHMWGEHKTIADLAAEVRAGESTLQVNDAGELRRHTAVAWVDVFATNERGERFHLKEARQEFHDGRPARVRNLSTSIGEKLLIGGDKPESPLAGARRALAEELGIDQVDMLGLMGNMQREEEAASYLGLMTVYTDHFFAVEVPFSPAGYREVQEKKTTYFEWEPIAEMPAERFEVALRRVGHLLPSLASDLVLGYQDMSDPANQSFAEYPDNPAEHALLWHQYGILTHSEKFREQLADDIPRLVEQGGVSTAVQSALNEKVEGITKGSLLQIAALLHDVGKFTARTITRTPEGSVGAHFTGHEAHSGAIIRFGLKETLCDLGFSERQVEYIARCAELHFELGKVRRTAIENGGYTLAFARSELGKQTTENIMTANPDYSLEIGLMFAADSLSKTEVSATAQTDSGIAAQKATLEAEIRAKGLHPSLIKQALQLPVNMEVAKQFLIIWAHKGSK